MKNIAKESMNMHGDEFKKELGYKNTKGDYSKVEIEQSEHQRGKGSTTKLIGEMSPQKL